MTRIMNRIMTRLITIFMTRLMSRIMTRIMTRRMTRGGLPRTADTRRGDPYTMDGRPVRHEDRTQTRYWSGRGHFRMETCHCRGTCTNLTLRAGKTMHYTKKHRSKTTSATKKTPFVLRSCRGASRGDLSAMSLAKHALVALSQ